MDRARGEPVGTKRDFRDGERADLWQSEQPLVFGWLGKVALEAGLPWSPTPHSTPRACLGGDALRAAVLSKILNKGDGMSWDQQDAALGNRPGLRAGFRPDAESWLPSRLPASLRLAKGHPRRHLPAQEQPSSCPEQRNMGQPMVSRQEWR